ncbi:hypothetical protein APSETT445_009580 [Aspergillus pseudonomiae]
MGLFLIGCSLANLVYGQTCQQSFRLYAYGEGIGGLSVFYADGTSGGNVGFKDPDDSARLDTKTLKLYGNYVLIDSQNANFFTTRSESGVYSLQWSANETATPNRIPLKLRAIQPSTDSVLAGGFNPRGEL